VTYHFAMTFAVLSFQNRWVVNSPRIFSQLRHVQIFLFADEVDKILYLVSLLRAAPFIENLGVHVSSILDRLFFCHQLFSTLS
jgi:hypothetical protein